VFIPGKLFQPLVYVDFLQTAMPLAFLDVYGLTIDIKLK
jgi:hypothetical protein